MTVKDIEFNEANEAVFNSDANTFSLFLKIDPEDDSGKRVIIQLYTSPDGEDFAFRDYVVNNIDSRVVFTSECGYSGVITGQYIKLVSNSKIIKCKVYYED